MKTCSECNSLEYMGGCNPDGDLSCGGASFSCEKGYFFSLPFPMQPAECVKGLPPKSPSGKTAYHGEETLNDLLKCPADCGHYNANDAEDYCSAPDICARHCYDLYERKE